jgi:hypothetical protein
MKIAVLDRYTPANLDLDGEAGRRLDELAQVLQSSRQEVDVTANMLDVDEFAQRRRAPIRLVIVIGHGFLRGRRLTEVMAIVAEVLDALGLLQIRLACRDQRLDVRNIEVHTRVGCFALRETVKICRVRRGGSVLDFFRETRRIRYRDIQSTR